MTPDIGVTQPNESRDTTIATIGVRFSFVLTCRVGLTDNAMRLSTMSAAVFVISDIVQDCLGGVGWRGGKETSQAAV